MQPYPRLIDNTIESVVNALSVISRYRDEDITANNNLAATFMAGRKVGKIPTSATDIASTDNIGDFNYDSNFYYIYVPSGSSGLWRFIPLIGTSTNDNAAAGNIGEYISSTIVQGSAVSLTTGTSTNVTGINLTAGDWDVGGNVLYKIGATTTISICASGASSSSATLPAVDKIWQYLPTSFSSSFDQGFPVPTQRFSLAASTTVYLVANATFAISTCSAYGNLFARRMR